MDLDCSFLFFSICYWGFLFGFLMSLVGEYVIYVRIDDEVRGDLFVVGLVVVRFFIEYFLYVLIIYYDNIVD